MASSTLTPYYDHTQSTAYALVSTSVNGSMWKAAGRSISEPLSIEIIRKFGPPSSLANDHVLLRLSQTNRNSTTGKLATLSATLDISVPKDTATLTADSVKYAVTRLASLIYESTVLPTTSVAVTALVEGRDL